MRYEDFAVRIEGDGRGGLVVRVLHSLEGSANAPFVPPWPVEGIDPLLRSLEKAVLRPPRRAAGSSTAGCGELDPRAIGARLFDALFTGRVGERWSFSRGRTAGESDVGLRLRLHFDLGDTAAIQVAALPWELLYDVERRDFLARSRTTPVVRYLDVTGRSTPSPAAPPLRVLLAAAAPRGCADLDLEGDLEAVSKAWSRGAGVEPVALPHATAEGLRQALIASPFHVLHFAGHGGYSPDRDDGVLLLERPGGGRKPLPARVLAQTLRDIPSLRLVVLSACDTAAYPRRHGTDPFTGVAVALVAAGLPAVVAMQFPITDRAAIEFGRALYGALAAGEPIDAAVVEGRQGIYRADPEAHEWATPVLYLRTSDGRVLDRLVAHSGTSPGIAARVIDASSTIEEKSRGFVGRRFAFEAIDAFRRRHPRGYFEVVGDPGIGKTAVAAELVRRGRHLHHFNQRAEGIVRPEAFLANLCAQLVHAYGLPWSALPAEATRDAGLLVALLAEVSRRLPEGQDCLIVVDALDESAADALPAGANPLLLPAIVPAGVFVVLTRRADEMPLRVDCERDQLHLQHDSPHNLADVRQYIESHLDLPGIRTFLARNELTAAAFVERMQAKSEGNFMYLAQVLPAVARGEHSRLDGERLPQGLVGYYDQQWRRLKEGDEHAWESWKLPVLEALAVARRPMPVPLLVSASGVADPRLVRRALRLWRPFLHVVETEVQPDARVKLYRLYHESFREFLAGKEELREVDLQRAEERLVEAFL